MRITASTDIDIIERQAFAADFTFEPPLPTQPVDASGNTAGSLFAARILVIILTKIASLLS